MAMRYNGQDVNNIQWDGETIFSTSSPVRLTVQTLPQGGTANNLVIDYEVLNMSKGEPSQVVMTVDHYSGEIGVSSNVVEERYPLDISRRRVTLSQTFGEGKYSTFSYYVIKQFNSISTVGAAPLWQPLHKELKGDTFQSVVVDTKVDSR